LCRRPAAHSMGSAGPLHGFLVQAMDARVRIMIMR